MYTWRAEEGSAHLSEEVRAKVQQADGGAHRGGGCRGPQRLIVLRLLYVRDAANRAHVLYGSLPSWDYW